MRRWQRVLMMGAAVLCALQCWVPGQTPPSAKPTTRTSTTKPAAALPQRFGTYRLASTVSVASKPMKLPYVLFLPDEYRANGPKLPVLLFLHGLGECGTDLDAVFIHGPNFELAKQGNEKFVRDFPMIVISPQCPPRGQRWDRDNMDQYLNALLDDVLPKLNVDLDRIYATGLSMGGLGTWRVARDRPDRYAGIAPISSFELEPGASVPKLSGIATLAVTGIGDSAQIEQSRRMIDGLQKAGDIAEFVMGPDGHTVWIRAYNCPRTYEWLLLNHRGQTTKELEAPADSRGISRRTYQSDPNSRRIDYLVRLPADVKSTDKRPLIIHFPDPEEFGKLQKGLPLHGPLIHMSELGQGKALPFIAVSPMLPPFSFSEWQQEDLTPLARFVKEMAQRYQADPARIYLAGSGDGARLAMLVARQPGVSPTAVVLELRKGSPAVEHIPTDQGAPSILLAATDAPDGDANARLQALVSHSPTGSELVVLKGAEAQKTVFTHPDLYARLLRIRQKPAPGPLPAAPAKP